MSKYFLRYDFIAAIFAFAGLLLGQFLPDIALSLEFLGNIFLLLLKMLIIPLVVTSIFLSIARLKTKEIKRLGSFTVGYYFLTSTIACITGIIVSNVFSFSHALNFDNLAQYDPSKLSELSFQSFITSFFSGNFFNALTEGNIVQIVVFTLFLAIASLKVETKHKETLINFCESVQAMMMVVINWIIFIAPLGVFSLLAALVAKTDTQVFFGLGTVFLGILFAVLIHSLVSLPLIALSLGKFNAFKYMGQCKRALMVALSTASSTATLPISSQVLTENNLVKPKTTGFVLPLGATLNMDGSALYQAIVVIFLGQMAGIDLNLYQEFLVFFFVMTSSAGTAGIPGGGMMMMGAVMEMVGIPLEYIGVYLLIDRVWDYPVTMINVLGDLIGAKTIDRYID